MRSEKKAKLMPERAERPKLIFSPWGKLIG
jgi:hypothetical protein